MAIHTDMIYVPDPCPLTLASPAPTFSPPNPLFHDLVDWHHRNHCGSNHIDMCGYEYYSWSDDFNRQQGTWNSKRRWAEDVVRWLRRDDAPFDKLIDSFIRREWNRGTLTADILRDPSKSWKEAGY